DSTDMVGMFRQYRFDVTNYIHHDQKNYLAVKIYPLDYPGHPSHPQLKALGPFYSNGGPTGDIGKNVTMLCSVGWDWMPAVRDREMGIWQPVFLSSSGSVTIDTPHIVTTLPNLPDTSRANLDISMKLSNHTSHRQQGKIKIRIKPKNFSGKSIQYTQRENLQGGQKKTIHLTPKNIDALKIKNPRLWWPNGYGRPNLYNLQISFTQGGRTSQTKNITFGIRTVSSKVTNVNGWARRDFYINGKEIDLTGGAWVPDLMLQRDSLRYKQELTLIKNANLNTVRIWGGGIAPPDAFFNEADRLGLLVWQDFWITGDTNGGFKGSKKWPLQGDVFIKNLKSTIKRLRNHPSLFLWTGGNEGHARKKLYDAMRNNVAKLDGTRPFISSSSGFANLPKGWKKSWPDDKKAGVYSSGPYSWQPPSKYYQLVKNGKDWLWKDEVGLPSQPPYSSLQKIIPDLVPDTTEPYPLNNTWGYHDAAAGNGKYGTYYNAIKNRYGAPKSYQDYSMKAQLVNANAYRAIFEAVGSQLDKTGGVLLWKINAAWPSVIWQLYDWFLNPNAGYYFTKRAVAPLHAQFNPTDSTVTIVNRRFKDQKNLSLQVRFYNAQMKKKFQATIDTSAPAHQATNVQSLSSNLKSQHGLTFISLKLQHKGGDSLSTHNIYWIAPGSDFSGLQNLAKIKLKASGARSPSDKNTYNIRLKNPTNKLAFFIHAKIEDQNGSEILPSYWSENYISIPPHGTRVLTVNLRDAPYQGKSLHLSLNGINIKPERVSLGKAR
ncbi:MAG TPA: glycoside hydrolase family 2 TIM barrel-domain containing protein, partial [Balneolaceae bacterium]|nr:glycoside hydrolase family 2 TIM barrel-domain containing protein [Balneolaceae bacterium]